MRVCLVVDSFHPGTGNLYLFVPVTGHVDASGQVVMAQARRSPSISAAERLLTWQFCGGQFISADSMYLLDIETGNVSDELCGAAAAISHSTDSGEACYLFSAMWKSFCLP